MTTKRKLVIAAAVLAVVVLSGLLPVGTRVAAVLSAVAGAAAGWYGRIWYDNKGLGEDDQTT